MLTLKLQKRWTLKNVSNHQVYIPERVLNDWVLSGKSRWVVSKQQKRRFECHPWGMGPGKLSYGDAAKLIWLNTDTYRHPPSMLKNTVVIFPDRSVTHLLAPSHESLCNDYTDCIGMRLECIVPDIDSEGTIVIVFRLKLSH